MSRKKNPKLCKTPGCRRLGVLGKNWGVWAGHCEKCLGLKEE